MFSAEWAWHGPRAHPAVDSTIAVLVVPAVFVLICRILVDRTVVGVIGVRLDVVVVIRMIYRWGKRVIPEVSEQCFNIEVRTTLHCAGLLVSAVPTLLHDATPVIRLSEMPSVAHRPVSS